jgi:hypothetical protein
LDKSGLNHENLLAELKFSSARHFNFDCELKIGFCLSHVSDLPVSELCDLSFNVWKGNQSPMRDKGVRRELLHVFEQTLSVSGHDNDW